MTFQLPRCLSLVLVLAALATSGCGGTRRGQGRIWTRSTAAQTLAKALEAPHADDRRRAVERITRSRFIHDPATLATLDVVLRTDQSSLVRRAAARCLVRRGTPEVCAPLMAVMTAESQPEQVRPADEALLRIVLEGFSELYASGIRCPDEPLLIQQAMDMLDARRARDVRISSARLLCHFQDRSVLAALIQVLQPGEFAVAYEAERSLERLTGHQLGRRQSDWQAWLQQTESPFATATRGQSEPPADSESIWSRLFK